MSKHTPGPWKLGMLKDEPRGGGCFRTIRGRGWIAHVRCNSDEEDANASLMSSAPDLLEACRAVDDAFDLYVDNASDPQAADDWYDAKDAAIQKVRAAIAKATGPTP